MLTFVTMEIVAKKSRKAQIEEKATALFREKGYAATSMRDLAQVLGIEAASLYSQYEEDDVRVALSGQRGFRFGIGPYASIKLSQKAKYKYENEQGNQKDKDKGGFYVNNFKWGLRAQIGINRFDMFVAYDMTPLFEDGKGPNLNPVTLGIVF